MYIEQCHIVAKQIASSFLILQILEEICQKSNWGQPIFTLHSTTANTDEEALFLYKVMVPGLSMTYIPAKLTRSIEEAKVIAADYSLVQLGYPMEGSYIVHCMTMLFLCFMHVLKSLAVCRYWFLC